MSKKHFIELANLIKANPQAFNQEAINLLANFCDNANPRFNRDRFLSYIADKCGPNGGQVKK